MGFFDIFKKKSKIPSPKKREFDFHEDDFCQVELLPFENISEILEDSKQIDDIRKNHSSKYGFTKIHVRSEKKVKTEERKIQTSEIEDIIKKTGFEKFDNVTTGYGSMKYDSEYSVAFGKPGCVLICERNKGLVDRLWLKYSPVFAKEDGQRNMKICLSEIGKRWNLILVDWNKNIQINLSDEAALKSYIEGT